MKNIPLNELFTFESVVRNNSFAKAAEELDLSHTSVKNQIVLLEVLLKSKLFNEASKELTLTYAGNILLFKIREGLDLIKEAFCDTSSPRFSSSSKNTSHFWLYNQLKRYDG